MSERRRRGARRGTGRAGRRARPQPVRRRRHGVRAGRPGGRAVPLDGAVGRAGGARRAPARAGRPDHRPALGRAHRRRLRPGAPPHLRAACPAGASPTRSVPSTWPDGSAPARLASMVRGAAAVRARIGRWAEPEDFESWAVERYGRPAFATLLDGYTDKLFGLPAREVDVGFAQSLVGAPRVGPAPVEVCRPHGGAGALLDAVAAEVERAGGSLRCGTEVARLAVIAGRVEGRRTTRRRPRAASTTSCRRSRCRCSSGGCSMPPRGSCSGWPRCAAAPR